MRLRTGVFNLVAGVVFIGSLARADSSATPTLLKQKFETSQIVSCIETLCGPADKNDSSYDSLKARREHSRLYQKVWNEFYAAKIKAALFSEAELGQSLSKLVDDELRFNLSTLQTEIYRAFLATASLLADEKFVKSAVSTMDLDPKKRILRLNKNRVQTWIQSFPKEQSEAIRFLTGRVILPLRNYGFAANYSKDPLTSLLSLKETGATNQRELANTILRLQSSLEKLMGPGVEYLAGSARASQKRFSAERNLHLLMKRRLSRLIETFLCTRSLRVKRGVAT